MDWLNEVKEKYDECKTCHYDCVSCPIAEWEYDLLLNNKRDIINYEVIK